MTEGLKCQDERLEVTDGGKDRETEQEQRRGGREETISAAIVM